MWKVEKQGKQFVVRGRDHGVYGRFDSKEAAEKKVAKLEKAIDKLKKTLVARP